MLSDLENFYPLFRFFSSFFVWIGIVISTLWLAGKAPDIACEPDWLGGRKKPKIW